MSDREKRDDQKDQHDQRDRQEELNPFSVRFDPLAALYSRNVTIPVVNAPTLDNISKFVAGTSGVQIKPTKTAQVKAEPLPVTVTPQQKSIDGWDNVVTRMKKVEGPLAVLRDCMEKKVKIKVYTRDMCGIRGHLTGFVVAFDKMWNLAMEDVTEVWRRRRKKKIPATVGASQDIPKGQLYRMQPPTLAVTKIDKKTEQCERRVFKLFVRGENVVLVSVLNI